MLLMSVSSRSSLWFDQAATGEGSLALCLRLLDVGDDEWVDCTGFDFLVDPEVEASSEYGAVAARWPEAKVTSRGRQMFDYFASPLTHTFARCAGRGSVRARQQLVAGVPSSPCDAEECAVQACDDVDSECEPLLQLRWENSILNVC